MDLLGTQACDHRVGNPVVAYTLYTCPRCLGKGYYGSLGFDVHGKVLLVSKGSQIEQAIYKVLTESKRASGYGFDYSVLTGTIDASTVSAIKSEIARCLQYLITAQTAAQALGTLYDPAEQISSINSISVVQDNVEPRKVTAAITVLTVANTTVSTVIPIQR
jgi:hypothetical protein